jgi:type VI secretion system protein ImpF
LAAEFADDLGSKAGTMARVREDQPLVMSILDRLIDDNPQSQQELPKSRNQVLRDLKQAVGRDLENLLNTRWRCLTWPPNLDDLDVSLVNYGIPDFTGAHMSLPSEREELRRLIEQVIRRYEPRFKSVTVTLRENKDEFDRTLRFRIDAVLYAEPAPEPVIFDSMLEPTSANFEIKASSQ